MVRVESGLRITIPFFTTFDRSRADPLTVGIAEAAAAAPA